MLKSLNYLITIVFFALIAMAGYASAGYRCSAIPQDNIHIRTNQVEIYGPSGSLMITLQGNVSRNGTALSISPQAQEQAKNYQSQLRKDLVFIYKGANQQIDDFYRSLDSALAKNFSVNGQTRAHLKDLKQSLIQQLNRVFTPTKDGLLFNAEAIKTVESESKTIIQRKLGAIAQDGINEKGAQGLQGLLSGIDDLKVAVQKVMQKQMQNSAAFVNQACGKARALDDRKQSLIRALPI